MKIISANVGLPRQVMWKGMKASTAIFKEPVDGPVLINPLNLRRGSNCPKKTSRPAAEHYEYWGKPDDGRDPNEATVADIVKLLSASSHRPGSHWTSDECECCQRIGKPNC